MGTIPDIFDYNNQIDQKNSLDTSRQLISVLGIDAHGNSQVQNQQNITFTSSFPGYTRDDMASMEQVFESMDKQYTEMLNQIQATNDLVNMNNYMQNIYNSESSRVTHLRDQSVNNVYKLREEYMTNKYNVFYTQYATRVIMMTLGVLIVCGITAICAYWGESPPISKLIALCIILTTLIFYFIILGLSYHRAMERRKDDWNKFYFNAPPGFGTTGCAK